MYTIVVADDEAELRPGVVILQLEIFVVEAENIFHVRIDFHGRQGARCSKRASIVRILWHVSFHSFSSTEEGKIPPPA